MPQICLLTDSRFLDPHDPDPLVQQVFTEEGLLSEALNVRGCRVDRKSWDEPQTNWSAYDLLVFRSTWDYMDRNAEFSQWLDRVSGQTRLVNPVEVIKWNMDKHYLADLEQKGVRIPPSLFIEKGEESALESLVAAGAWDEVILKPLVSAGARHTYRFHARDSKQHEEVFRELIAGEGMMLQEFQESVLSGGELSLVMIDGRYSHSVRKNARSGDYRVQDDFGGSVHRVEPDEAMLEFASMVLERCSCSLPYARVDILLDRQGRPQLTELELIEPELWFRLRPSAATELAEAILVELH